MSDSNAVNLPYLVEPAIPNISMDQSPSIKGIAKALLEAQKKMGAAKKGADNPYFSSKYADFNSVLSTCKDLLNASGVVILQPVSVVLDKCYVTTKLIHAETGEWVSSTMELMEVSNMQKVGSSVSYARRYTLQSLVTIPTSEDDDGNAATGKKGSSSKPTTTSKPSAAAPKSGFGSK